MDFAGAFTFLIQALFGLYSILIVSRFMLQLSGADFYNPVSQTVVRATRIPLVAMRKVLPAFGRFDTASLVWLIIVQMIMIVIVKGSLSLLTVMPLSVLEFALRETALLILNFWTFTLFIEIIGSWISMGQYNPFLDLVSQLNRPIMDPLRRFIPPLGGLDLSPMIALLLIATCKRLFFGMPGM